MNKKVWRTVLIVGIILIVLALGFLVYNFFFAGKNNAPEPEIPPEVSSEEPEVLVDNPIDFATLKAENEDICAWITIPDTAINYGVYCSSPSEQESFYLYHNTKKQYEFAGSIYMQRLNKTDFSDPNTVLYGHNMKNGSMFAGLHKFRHQDYFDAHPEIFIYTPDRILTYTIFSAYLYDDRHILNSFDFTNKDVYASYLEFARNPKSTMVCKREDVSVTADDKIVTLCTCANVGDGRYLVQGVLTNEQKTR